MNENHAESAESLVRLREAVASALQTEFLDESVHFGFVGSLAGDSASIAARLRFYPTALDLDLLVLFPVVTEPAVRRLRDAISGAVKHAKGLGCPEASLWPANCAYKGPDGAKRVVIHLIVHETKAFLERQPQHFLLSWRHVSLESTASESSISLANTYSSRFGGEGLSPRSLISDSYGLNDSIRLIELLRDGRFEHVQWKESPDGFAQSSDLIVVDSWEARRDLLRNLVAWAAANTLRATSGAAYEPSPKILKEFESVFAKRLPGSLARLPSELFDRTRPPSENHLGSAVDDSARLLAELLRFAECGLTIESARALSARVLAAHARTNARLKEALGFVERSWKLQPEPPSVAFQSVETAAALGYEASEELLAHFRAVMGSDSAAAGLVRNLVRRRFYYYILPAFRGITLLAHSNPARNLGSPEFRSILEPLKEYASPWESDRNTPKKLGDLVGISETTVDSRLFTLLRAANRDESRRSSHEAIAAPLWLLEELVREVSVSGFDGERFSIMDRANLWWAFEVLHRPKNQESLRAGAPQQHQRFIELWTLFVVLEESWRPVVAENATKRENTTEILIPSRSRCFMLINAISIARHRFSQSIPYSWKEHHKICEGAMRLVEGLVEAESQLGPNHPHNSNVYLLTAFSDALFVASRWLEGELG